MKMLFKQRLFSWFDSYDIFDEEGNILYKVKGELSWGHQLRIYDSKNNEVGLIKEKIFTLLPKFVMFENGIEIGEIRKQFTFFIPKFNLTCNDWNVTGNILEWDYEVIDSNNNIIMNASKEIFHLTDTYVIDVKNKKDALYSLMIVLAIDAAKCSNNTN